MRAPPMRTGRPLSFRQPPEVRRDVRYDVRYGGREAPPDREHHSSLTRGCLLRPPDDDGDAPR